MVCLPTLVWHRAFEIEKFIPNDILNPLQYARSIPEWASLRIKFQNHNVIVTSYDVLRKDMDILAQQVWNYCIFYEGRIIKSIESKIPQATNHIPKQIFVLLWLEHQFRTVCSSYGLSLTSSCLDFLALSARYYIQTCLGFFLMNFMLEVGSLITRFFVEGISGKYTLDHSLL